MMRVEGVEKVAIEGNCCVDDTLKLRLCICRVEKAEIHTGPVA
jgi:hypothetical protein